MDAQPNIGKLVVPFTTTSTAPATASQEIALVLNIPAFNNGQNILAAIQAMSTNVGNLITTMRTDITTLTTDVATLTTDIATLTTDVNTLCTNMNTRFDNLELRISAESVYFSLFLIFIIIIFYSSLNYSARVYNSRISSRDTPLRVLHDQRNIAVAGYPRDSASLMRLSGQTKSHIEELFIKLIL